MPTMEILKMLCGAKCDPSDGSKCWGCEAGVLLVNLGEVSPPAVLTTLRKFVLEPFACFSRPDDGILLPALQAPLCLCSEPIRAAASSPPAKAGSLQEPWACSVQLCCPQDRPDGQRPAEAPTSPEMPGGPEGMTEPLTQCAAWLEAYFHKPAVLEELPVPALHHPIFQQGVAKQDQSQPHMPSFPLQSRSEESPASSGQSLCLAFSLSSSWWTGASFVGSSATPARLAPSVSEYLITSSPSVQHTVRVLEFRVPGQELLGVGGSQPEQKGGRAGGWPSQLRRSRCTSLRALRLD
ncbi:hypothetical protein CB1_000436006 [Camelus ferus]|nr:hypothetical protein CB1_000436006 [Camelus ferus]